MRQFRLQESPVDVQLTYHIAGLMTYFHSQNKDVRNPIDKNHFSNTADVLKTMDLFIMHPFLIEEFLTMRQLCPLEFRVAQLFQHYGPEKLQYWLELVYGVSFGEGSLQDSQII